jgi:hypothetical protein
MTILLDEVGSKDLAGSTVGLNTKCSWCGEIIRLNDNELRVAMCQSCYDVMLAEFLRAKQFSNSPYASER